VHHLFPSICHTHYPAIAPIVLQTCKEFSVPYVVYPTVRQSFILQLATVCINVISKCCIPLDSMRRCTCAYIQLTQRTSAAAVSRRH
jgi:hypothetical protein